MTSLTRHKLNEYFEFPEEIDMAPYRIDYLKDKEQGLNPTLASDKFILVGTLVHQGNAEVGHYYSYVRERPGFRKSWVEMNDTDVSAFDPANIREMCFGGWSEHTFNGYPQQRNYNAYMLFYQRVSSMEAEANKFALSDISRPVRASISSTFADPLVVQNELWIRKYCLFGEDYIKFFRKTIETFRKISNEQCSDDHKLENDLIGMIILHTERIFAREKNCQNERETILNLLGRMTERCSSCCATFLRIMAGMDGVMRALMFKCPDESFRKRVQNLLLESLKHMKDLDIQLYAPCLDNQDGASPSSPKNPLRDGLFMDVAMTLKSLIETMHQLPRVWDDYYELLMTVASLGGYEKAVVHELGLLLGALHILDANARLPRSSRWNHVDGFVKSRNRRRISLKKLVEFVTMLMKGAKLSPDTDGSNSRRYDEYSLGEEELDLLIETHDDEAGSRIVTLQTVFATDLEPEAFKDYVRALLQCQWLVKPERQVYYTIIWALEVNSLSYSSLLAGSAFCSYAPNPSMVRDIIQRIAEETHSVVGSGGSEFFDFFSEVARTTNPFLARRLGPNVLRKEVIKCIPRFAPYLLICQDKAVRSETGTFLNEMIIHVEVNDDEHYAELIGNAGRGLLKSCFGLGMEVYRQRRTFDSETVDDFLFFCRLCFREFMSEEVEGYEMLHHQYSSMLIKSSNLRVETNSHFSFTELADAMRGLILSSPNEALSGEYDSDDVLTDASNVDNTF